MLHYTPKYVSFEEHLLKQICMLRRYAEILRSRFLRIYRHAANSHAMCLSSSKRNMVSLRKDLLGMRPNGAE